MMAAPSSLLLAAAALLAGCCALGAVDAFVVPAGGGPAATTRSTGTSLHMNKKKGKAKGKKSSSGGGKGFGAAPVAAALQSLANPAFQYAGTVLPGTQSPQRVVTDPAIVKPDYALDGTPKNRPQMLPWVIEQKTPEEIAKMRAAGRVAREVLDIAGRLVRPGITTDEIDTVVHEETLKRGAYPSPLNYHGFPKSCCTSVNEGERCQELID
jgi:hypothetical protein